ncbi:MAG: hypothetical protein ACR2PA_01225, partial [Hyphomicrobiaceae bacterium]
QEACSMADNANGDHPHFETPPHERTWIDDPKNVDRIVFGLYGLCALLIVIDPFVHKHGPFAIEHFWGFYAFYGFVACVGLVLAAKWLRTILMRSEDYYDQ